MPQFNGTAGDDNINGTDEGDDIFGFAGNDLILGRSGFDRLHGGEGNDTIYAGDGGFAGLDLIEDGPGDDMVFGEEDMDSITASPGNDTYDGGTGTTGPFGLDFDSVYYDSALAGIVVDLRLSTGQVRSIGASDAAGIGVDTLLNIEMIYGSGFDDVMTAASGVQGNSALYGGGGNDTLTGGSSFDTLAGGEGNDLIDGGGGNDTVRYTASGMTVSLAISGPQDTGEGIDTLISIENLWGASGNDLLTGNGGTNWIYGDSGNDVIIGGASWDDLEGGSGDDVYIFESASDHPTGEITDFDGWDEIRYAATSAGTLTVFGADEGIERVVIGTGTGANAVTSGLTALNIDATAAQNGLVIVGNDGANTLLGSAFEDNISGGGGNDLIIGGSDGDSLTGGAGTDTFQGTKNDLNGDTITDFRIGDRVLFTDATLGSFSYGLNGGNLTYTGGTVTLSGPITGPLAISAATGGGVQLTSVLLNTRVDFNGDGRDDILWQHNNGIVTNWLGQANGSMVGNIANFGAPTPSGGHIVGVGDFNGDGRGDILWQHDNGIVTNWLGQANGSMVGNIANFGAPTPSGGHIVGVGDFNGDGRDDILWQHDNGLITDWLGQANGGMVGNIANFGAPTPVGGHIIGVGDFNGDGRDDILWQHDNGLVTDWLGQANGGMVGNIANFGAPTPDGGHIVGIGDFNGDGRDDILWQHDNGLVTNWLGQANGGMVGNIANFGAPTPPGGHIAGIGDYNGDGRDDILWQHDNGLITNWLGQANGGMVGNIANFGAPTPAGGGIVPYDYWL